VATERQKMLSQTVRVVLVALLMGAAPTGTAIAGPFEDGLAAHGRGDYAEAAKNFRKAAEQGDASAHYNLGVLYKTGKGVPQDNAEAVKWFQKAADQGSEPAQSRLGFMYRTGQGVLQDFAEAVKWYRKAAEQGNATVQGVLGVL
jgi:TPR repeat protein